MERKSEISGLDEQYDPAEAAINEQQGPVDLAFIDAMRARSKAVTEVGSNPSTHPLNRGGWKAPTVSEIARIPDPEPGQPK